MKIADIKDKDCRYFFQTMKKYSHLDIKNGSIEKMYQAFRQRMIEEQHEEKSDDKNKKIVDKHGQDAGLGYYEYSPD